VLRRQQRSVQLRRHVVLAVTVDPVAMEGESTGQDSGGDAMYKTKLYQVALGASTNLARWS
jgi:hypothetical protein